MFTTSKIEYRDFWFKIIGSLVASEIIDSIGREESYLQRFTTSYFYTDLFGGFIIALLLWEFVRYVVLYLDRRYAWMEKTIQRILLQLFLGVVIPAILCFFLTLLYMKLAYNQDIFQTQWLYNEFYTVILIIILINLVYFTWWLYFAWKKHYIQTFERIAGPQLLNEKDNPSMGRKHKIIEVNKAGKTILLSQEKIASVYLNNGYCYIKTFQEELYVTTYSMDEIEDALDQNVFFRANRQTLVNRKCCVAYQSVENGKIKLDLVPSLKYTVVVSQKKASNFRKWISATD